MASLDDVKVTASASTTFTVVDSPSTTIDWARVTCIPIMVPDDPKKKKDEDKLRIKVSRKAMFSKRGKMYAHM